VVPSSPPANIEDCARKCEIPIDPDVFVPGKPLSPTFVLLDVKLELLPVPPQTLGLAANEAAWEARLPNGDEAFFLRIGDAIEGRIRIGGKLYRVRSKTRMTAMFEVYDENEFYEHGKTEAQGEGISVPDASGTLPPSGGDVQCEDPIDQIDLLVLYTSAAAKASEAGPTAAGDGIVPIINEITTAVEHTNLVYDYSGAKHRLNLVGTAEAPEFPNDCIEDASTGELVCAWNAGRLLGALANPNRAQDFGPKDYELDPAFNRIHALRESSRADLVALVFEGPSAEDCGIAKQPKRAAGASTRHRAYSVVKRDCSVAYMSFAHEIGHNLGGGHDGNDCGEYNLEYNCGYAASSWQTIMHRRKSCGAKPPTTDGGAGGAGSEVGMGGAAGAGGEPECWRIALFSNPDVQYQGQDAGVEDAADMVRVFEETSGPVSRYRCKRSGVAANVWMKDHWNDEGGEPKDLASVGKPMWQSPYIWVRHEADPQRQHEHSHENPKAGTNYVYVKLHNNGDTAESSTLELYYAPATTNLDEIEWKPIGVPQPYTVGPEPGVKVVELVWEDPAIVNDGTYSLLARWNIDESPFEQVVTSGDLQGLVRADNDLIWRSNHLIELIEPPVEGSMFAMVGEQEPGDSFLLITTDSMTAQEVDWEGLGPALIEVDPSFDHGGPNFAPGLKRTAPRGKFELPLDGIPRLIGPFELGHRQPAVVRLKLRTDSNGPKDAGLLLTNPAHYDITFMQLRSEAVRPNGTLDGTPSSVLATKGLVIGGISYTLRILPSG